MGAVAHLEADKAGLQPKPLHRAETGMDFRVRPMPAATAVAAVEPVGQPIAEMEGPAATVLYLATR